jgi:hypothetical protein
MLINASHARKPRKKLCQIRALPKRIASPDSPTIFCTADDNHTHQRLPHHAVAAASYPYPEIMAGVPRSGPPTTRSRDNDTSLEDPFVSNNSTLPELSHVPATSFRFPRPQVELTTPPNWSVLHDGRGGAAALSGAYHHADSNQNPNMFALGAVGSFAQAGCEIPSTPQQPIQENVDDRRDDRRPTSVIIGHFHPFRNEIRTIREDRRQREAMWRHVTAERPKEAQDVNWPIGKTHEQKLKKCCTEEYDLLQFIQRLEEGESYKDLNLQPEMLTLCLQYDDNQKKRNKFNAPRMYGSPNYNEYFPNPPLVPHRSSETILPSIERDGYDDQDKLNIKTENYLTLPQHGQVNPPRRAMPSSALPHPTALGQSSSSLRRDSDVTLAMRLDRGREEIEEFFNIDRKQTKKEIIDFKRELESVEPRENEPARVLANNDRHPSTPRIQLTATGLAQKHLRSGGISTLFGSHHKRQKFITDYHQSETSKDPKVDIQTFRADPAVTGREMPEHAVSSEKKEKKDENEMESLRGLSWSSSE